MRLLKAPLFFLLLCGFISYSQIKIGDNPQNIDPSSILELESTTRAFVINRVTTAQMNSIVPIEGAMVYNTDIQCLHYFNGENWLNLCEALGLTITNNPIVHPDTTIAITRVDNNINIEVDSITGLQIVDRSIRGDDIAGSAVNGSFHIQNRSVPVIKLIPSATPNQILKTNAAGTDAVWATPPIAPVAFGKVNGNTAVKIYPTTLVSVGGSTTIPSVSFIPPRPDGNYTIQLTISGENRIALLNQNPNGFTVEISDSLGNPPSSAIEWYFTIFDF
ncbi:MAG: hypothetical protein KJO93_05360 [Muriicola sp.]|nr:hypothetical protein [Muriicola sp.]NNK35435.1 hypothetical protein [Eudoraea sp.]